MSSKIQTQILDSYSNLKLFTRKLFPQSINMHSKIKTLKTEKFVAISKLLLQCKS